VHGEFLAPYVCVHLPSSGNLAYVNTSTGVHNYDDVCAEPGSLACRSEAAGDAVPSSKPNDNADEAAPPVLDERQDLLQWWINPCPYNRRTVWKAEGISLHPGAAHYYREMGYMK